jgi:hypothetical protein
MKKLFKTLMVFIFIVLSVFWLFKYYSKDYVVKNINIKNESLNYNVKYKGLKNAVDFTVDKQGNHYIAYEDRIQVIKRDGKSYDILKDEKLNIYSIEFLDNKLYYASDTKVFCYNLDNQKNSEIINNIPSYGDYKNSIIKIRGDYLYVAVGSATNSGVVGEDNSWVKDNFYAHDVTPKDITLKGLNFGKDKTGAFQSYKTKSIKGQIIPEHFPGNASVIIYNLKTGNSETLAWGIRNITGMDFNSDGKLISSVGGMEDRGARPIKGDTDYIYEIKKGVWYGWPDYSGGDPVTSPKFKTAKGVSTQFILENHPTTNPPAPLYQHNGVGTIKSLAVDINSILEQKNCIYFYDKLNNVIYGFSGAGSVKEEVKFNENTLISSIKFEEKTLTVLDGKGGCLYTIEKGKASNGLKVGKSLYIYLLATTVLGIFVLLKLQKD